MNSVPNLLAMGKAWSGLAMLVHIQGGTDVIVLGEHEEACRRLIGELKGRRKPFDPAKCYPAILVAAKPVSAIANRQSPISPTPHPTARRKLSAATTSAVGSNPTGQLPARGSARPRAGHSPRSAKALRDGEQNDSTIHDQQSIDP